jgi:uncharacterized protein with HEPN domain
MLDVRDTGYLFAILKMCDDIESYKVEYSSIEATLRKRSGINAVLMNLSQIGEYAGRVSDKTKKKYDTVDWKRIKGLRNIIVHDYFGVDVEKLHSILTTDIPVLMRALIDIIRHHAATGEIEPGLIDAADRDMKSSASRLPGKKRTFPAYYSGMPTAIS